VALAVQPHVVAKDGARYLKLCSPVVADTTILSSQVISQRWSGSVMLRGGKWLVGPRVWVPGGHRNFTRNFDDCELG